MNQPTITKAQADQLLEGINRIAALLDDLLSRIPEAVHDDTI